MELLSQNLNARKFPIKVNTPVARSNFFQYTPEIRQTGVPPVAIMLISVTGKGPARIRKNADEQTADALNWVH